MARAKLPYFNVTEHGDGMEGAANYANIIVDNLLVPVFLFCLYGVLLYVWSNSDKRMSTGVMFISLIFFLMAIIAQTFTSFSQLVIFVFFVGILVGIGLRFTE